nr:MAG: hypothetical protein [Cressdnaviricota sp.]
MHPREVLNDEEDWDPKYEGPINNPKPTVSRGWKRNYQGKLVKWSTKRNRYETLVPQTEQGINDVLDRNDGPFRVRPTNAFDPRGRYADKRGYGGTEAWPFDFVRACTQDGYRRGIYNAMHGLWTSDYWKFHTQRELDRVWRVRRAAAKTVYRTHRAVSFQQALEEQIQYNAF